MRSQFGSTKAIERQRERVQLRPISVFYKKILDELEKNLPGIQDVYLPNECLGKDVVLLQNYNGHVYQRSSSVDYQEENA